MRSFRPLIKRYEMQDEWDNFDRFLEKLNGIRSKYPGKLIEVEYDNGACTCAEDQYCYCPFAQWNVCVYDVELDKKKRKG